MTADYAMCPSGECPARRECWRNPDSGRQADERQVRSYFEPGRGGKCRYFVEKEAT